ncbi:nitroreductase family deazaflavin-dependent oxidoreductase [Segniliparus rugosus]|uniref:Deazaflavin-dependent nitroreductase n=1 Tax=Segniliparus rugosus (strain ATCC BAA-974 / DSM 45345 / CCUG 50838 / CIP 108380 / JCM 13579 / CDC 945) TaxID=679197 RepID=E5XN73_SEGRC|nr:nitroreductase family deazaflavin-dependent oxidoreductase [Segniliparus rugosus]EFV14204.1 deazaflavin-dependent nitroreductase [Segniliparus rugosus ATCC BAA-974]
MPENRPTTSLPLDPSRTISDAHAAPASVLGAINDNFIAHLRANGGRIVEGPLTGQNWLVLHVVGAKTGKERAVPLFYLDHEERWYLVGSFAGGPNDPAWAHNLRANPAARVEVGTQTRAVTARELTGPEREEVWAALLARAPYFTDYQAKTARLIPLFELVRG